MKIVLSYRRSDAPGMTGWIYEQLTRRYGEQNVFRDIDSIPFGVDFRKHIQKQLDGCDVLLAVIGPRWLGEAGDQRINNEHDWVRLEVETALQRMIPIVPILVEGATMPRPDQLPETIRDLSFYNAAPVDSGRDFYVHVERLIRSLEHQGDSSNGPGPHRWWLSKTAAQALVVCIALSGLGSGLWFWFKSPPTPDGEPQVSAPSLPALGIWDVQMKCSDGSSLNEIGANFKNGILERDFTTSSSVSGETKISMGFDTGGSLLTKGFVRFGASNYFTVDVKADLDGNSYVGLGTFGSSSDCPFTATRK